MTELQVVALLFVVVVLFAALLAAKGRRQAAPFHGNIEEQTLQNTDYRRVLHTTPQQQLVLMRLRPGEEIGSEVHRDLTQFFRVERGSGVALVGKQSFDLADGSALVVPPDTRHNVTAGPEGLLLYTIYSPPHHRPGLVQPTKVD